MPFSPTKFRYAHMRCTVAAYLLIRNVLWREFICTEICGGYVKKSSKWFYNSAPKVEEHYLQSFTCLSHVHIKYNSSHDFAAYYFISQQYYKFTVPRILFSIYLNFGRNMLFMLLYQRKRMAYH
jgi:hypothetical protein